QCVAMAVRLNQSLTAGAPRPKQAFEKFGKQAYLCCRNRQETTLYVVESCTKRAPTQKPPPYPRLGGDSPSQVFLESRSIFQDDEKPRRNSANPKERLLQIH
ncbi:MAG: hypothetical protein KJZ57_06875, partial [Anaerolineales bacterium]|nr:hypothetical protein [Anaerolineales bacterium]